MDSIVLLVECRRINPVPVQVYMQGARVQLQCACGHVHIALALPQGYADQVAFVELYLFVEPGR